MTGLLRRLVLGPSEAVLALLNIMVVTVDGVPLQSLDRGLTVSKRRRGACGRLGLGASWIPRPWLLPKSLNWSRALPILC